MVRKRTTITTGVYSDKSGVAIVVSVDGKPREFRKDADGQRYTKARGGAAWYRDERKRVQAREQLKTTRQVDATDTFPSDVRRFLKTISSPGHRLNTQGYMAHWEQHFADKRRNQITDVDAQTAFAAINQSDSTRIHIRRALIQFYETLNGKSGYNPGRSLQKPPKPEEPIRDLPWRDIEAMFAAMQPSKAKARLMLIAYIGLPQKQIKALRPNDLRLERRELIAHPRRKGAGVSGQVQPLSDYAIAALKEFARVGAFGSFQNLQLVRAFHSAAKRANVTLPDWARPYDLRHSFLTEVARGGADIEEISKLGIHATLQQAARYIKGVAAERATNAIMAVPRFRATTKPRKKGNIGEFKGGKIRSSQRGKSRRNG